MNKTTPKFKNEDEEAKWWASLEGRAFLKRQPICTAKKRKQSPLVSKLSRSPRQIPRDS
jgi:hypothetical protein